MSYDINDWLEGKVFLNEEENYHTAYLERYGEEITIVRIEDFDENSRVLIRKHQETFFNEEVEYEYNQVVKEFNDRYLKSQFKNLLIERLTEILDSILFKNSEKVEMDELSENWHLTAYNGTGYISELKRYFRSVYINGSNRDYSVVSSKLSPHTITIPPPQVLAEVLFLFFQNLKSISGEKELNFDNKFWSLETFELFNYLSENLVESTVLKKYNLIFHYLKLLNEDDSISNNFRFKMSKSKYIDFITLKINSEFSKNGKPKMNPPDTGDKEGDFLPLLRLKLEFDKSRDVDLSNI
jgi:hypothetical protein